LTFSLVYDSLTLAFAGLKVRTIFSGVTMSATVTVTGTVGPGNTLTTGVFSGVSEFTINCETNMIYFTQPNAQGNTRKEVSINAATTVTATKSGTTWTLTIS
jgi:hypothetical protein